eukprot:TRINITY_DN46579_c0_g1_i1.p1 TRINITY_DN46579_c0_g1~~TRINITY_DN46579_c0_g1_i1.p1  ORF type:complete len:247 (+),score=71.39 TRINITY_DN46579_c0_g1_i1:50-790(+)
MRLLLFTCLLTGLAHAGDFNIVNLDNNTMRLLVGKELPAFVRFDKEYAYGEKADAFKALAANASGAQVLIGAIGISTYGEFNQDLAEKFGYKTPGKEIDHVYMDKNFPKFRLFPANGGESIEYSGDVTTDAMMLFLKKEAKIYFGLRGTLRDFDKFASEFMKASDKQQVLQRAKAAADKVDGADKETASYYVKAMEKSSSSADWVQKEFDRLSKMVSDGKISVEKKDGMKVKMNRLSAFVTPNDEL